MGTERTGLDVGDACWKWDGDGGVMERFRKIEKLNIELDGTTATYVDRKALALHSKDGAVNLSYNHWLGSLK